MWLSILYFWKKNTHLFFQKRRRVIPWSLNLFERKYYEFALPLRISENGNPKFLLYSFELKPSQVSCLAKNIWFHNCCSFHLWPQILIRSLLTFSNCNTKDYWIYFYSEVNVSTSAIRFLKKSGFSQRILTSCEDNCFCCCFRMCHWYTLWLV